MTALADTGEDALIRRLVPLLPAAPEAAAGPGDDCAVIDNGPGFSQLVLLKTDALVEHVHFAPDAPPRAIGWKAVARVVSDFAAMGGGRPERFLIAIALPASTAVDWIEDVYRGMADCMEAFGGTLAGGETTAVPAGSAAVIVVSATGAVPRDQLVLRSTARPGDLIFTTGTLGGSIHGKHLSFTPRTTAADWLAAHFRPSAMMDLSDGLAKDLPRLAAASGCGARIECQKLPVTPGSDINGALRDGEDFELLFTLSLASAEGLPQAWATAFPDLKLSEIGQLTPLGEGDDLVGGWDHFARP